MSAVTDPTAQGLAAERTTLAWQRTALALAANGGLLLLRAPLGGAVGAVVAGVAFVLAGAVALLAARRARSLARDPDGPAVPAWSVVLLAAGVAGLALGAAVAVLRAA